LGSDLEKRAILVLEFLVVGVGGCFGSMGRHALTKIMVHFGFVFPLGTLLSNTIAGILVGFIFVAGKNLQFSPHAILLLRTGFLGGLSTFSAFSLETVRFAQTGSYGLAAANVGLNLFLSLIGVIIGQSLAQFIKI
jgi:CrcB protein